MKAVRSSKRVNDAIKGADRRNARDFTIKKKRGAVGVRGRRSSASEAYDGAFAVVKKNDTTVTILGYNPPDRLIHNYVIAGLERFEVVWDADLVVASTSVVYAHISYSGSYSIAYLVGSLPAQSDRPAERR